VLYTLKDSLPVYTYTASHCASSFHYVVVNAYCIITRSKHRAMRHHPAAAYQWITRRMDRQKVNEARRILNAALNACQEASHAQS
jgi:hypothetical protein